eukprot:GHVP01013305.1.p1 GENE.GHVP01013305.1~~GHVP01013305.1.p1  ORF type:complete len:101 (-),score=21.56 GHVP01013305.1:298-600(-)
MVIKFLARDLETSFEMHFMAIMYPLQTFQRILGWIGAQVEDFPQASMVIKFLARDLETSFEMHFMAISNVASSKSSQASQSGYVPSPSGYVPSNPKTDPD